MAVRLELKQWDKKSFRSLGSGHRVVVISGTVAIIFGEYNRLLRPGSGGFRVPSGVRYKLWAYEQSVVNVI